jgi:arginase
MRISLIGVPMYLGADRLGVDLGPTAIRYAGIEKKLTDLRHEVGPFETVPVPAPASTPPPDDPAKYLVEITAAANALAARVAHAIQAHSLPITLGGDHCIALGSVSGAAKANGSVGVIWVDAHGDFNTVRTTPSGHIHGMILAALCGYDESGPGGKSALTSVAGGGPHLDPKRVVIVGARELDPGEKRLLGEAGVQVRTMADVDDRGMADVMREAISIATDGTHGLHVSFDLDALDPQHAPGVGTPVPGGLSLREAHLAMETVASSGKLTSLDLVEVNPLLDVRNQTAELAVELALSAVGKRII